MSPSSAFASSSSIWRLAGSTLALVAALSFALQPTISLAQTVVVDPDSKVQTKPKSAHANTAAKKPKSRTSPTDNLSEDLNRREAERAERVVRTMTSSPVPAATVPLAAAAVPPVEVSPASAVPPTVAAIPPRASIVSASLTPEAGLSQPTVDRNADQFTQAQSQSQSQFTPTPPAPQMAQAPAPVPIPPSTTPGAGAWAI